MLSGRQAVQPHTRTYARTHARRDLPPDPESLSLSASLASPCAESHDRQAITLTYVGSPAQVCRLPEK